jgi:NTE family protein
MDQTGKRVEDESLIGKAYRTTLASRKESVGAKHKSHKAHARPPFECIALLLQGGGALGAYQAGVYEALAEAHLDPDWVAGISIGALNSALIAGNPPATRIEKLRQFWELITTAPLWGSFGPLARDSKVNSPSALIDHAVGTSASLSAMGLALATGKPLKQHADELRAVWANIAENAGWVWPSDPALFTAHGDIARTVANQFSAGLATLLGAQGFFAPRAPVPWLQPPGTIEATSYYDSSTLKSTLERLVDFDRINAGEMRLSLGAVNIATGNFVYFDNTTHTILPEHIMASGALPPAFPAVAIDGEYYWDGGLVSNTPLQWVLESEPRRDTLAFQVDLWSARGAFPRNMAEVMTRQKEIQYSSRTRANSDRFKHAQKIRNALSNLFQKLPDALKDSPELAVLRPVADHKVYNLVQLIYRSKQYEGDSKDYEFSRQSMEEHWRAGYHDTVRTLRHPEVLERPRSLEGVLTFDLAQDGRE